MCGGSAYAVDFTLGKSHPQLFPEGCKWESNHRAEISTHGPVPNGISHQMGCAGQSRVRCTNARHVLCFPSGVYTLGEIMMYAIPRPWGVPSGIYTLGYTHPWLADGVRGAMHRQHGIGVQSNAPILSMHGLYLFHWRAKGHGGGRELREKGRSDYLQDKLNHIGHRGAFHYIAAMTDNTGSFIWIKGRSTVS